MDVNTLTVCFTGFTFGFFLLGNISKPPSLSDSERTLKIRQLLERYKSHNKSEVLLELALSHVLCRHLYTWEEQRQSQKDKTCEFMLKTMLPFPICIKAYLWLLFTISFPLKLWGKFLFNNILRYILKHQEKTLILRKTLTEKDTCLGQSYKKRIGIVITYPFHSTFLYVFETMFVFLTFQSVCVQGCF